MICKGSPCVPRREVTGTLRMHDLAGAFDQVGWCVVGLHQSKPDGKRTGRGLVGVHGVGVGKALMLHTRQRNPYRRQPGLAPHPLRTAPTLGSLLAELDKAKQLQVAS